MQERPGRTEPPKPLVGRPFKEVSDMKNQHAERIMSIPNVVGVGIKICETEDSRYFAMGILLEQEPTPEQLETREKTIEGVPVVYEVVGEIKLQTSQLLRQ